MRMAVEDPQYVLNQSRFVDCGTKGPKLGQRGRNTVKSFSVMHQLQFIYSCYVFHNINCKVVIKL